jgi:hypothetical protein
MSFYTYKGVNINNLLVSSETTNTSLDGAGTAMPKSPIPRYSFEKPFFLNIKYKDIDISEYVTSYYKDYNTTSGVITETLPINGVNFKHISAYGWGGGGGGGGCGGKGLTVGFRNSPKHNDGGNGGSGAAGGFVAIQRYPIGNTIEIGVGIGGTAGTNGNDKENQTGKGGNGNSGTNGNSTYIKINNITVINAYGGTGGTGGIGGSDSAAGGNGSDGTTTSSNIVSDYIGTLTAGGAYPNRNSGNGGTGCKKNTNITSGNNGFIRIYYHYS